MSRIQHSRAVAAAGVTNSFRSNTSGNVILKYKIDVTYLNNKMYRKKLMPIQRSYRSDNTAHVSHETTASLLPQFSVPRCYF